MTNEKKREYNRIWYYNDKYHHYLRPDDDVKRKKYKFVREYENFILLERLDIHVYECFKKEEAKQLEVIYESR